MNVDRWHRGVSTSARACALHASWPPAVVVWSTGHYGFPGLTAVKTSFEPASNVVNQSFFNETSALPPAMKAERATVSGGLPGRGSGVDAVDRPQLLAGVGPLVDVAVDQVRDIVPEQIAGEQHRLLRQVDDDGPAGVAAAVRPRHHRPRAAACRAWRPDVEMQTVLAHRLGAGQRLPLGDERGEHLR